MTKGKKKQSNNVSTSDGKASDEDLVTDDGLVEALPEDPLTVLEAEVTKLKDQLLRALAETENTRRRADREHKDLLRYGVTSLVRDILAVADNLRRALDSVPSEARGESEVVATLATGVELTEKEFLNALERHHVRKIEPMGEMFNHNEHQAMFEVDSTGEPAGTIVELLQPGYMLHDRLLRPAMVGVAKGPAEKFQDKIEEVD